MSQTKGKRNQILSDHKRVGNRFIPPLLQATSFRDLSWVDCTLPELLWIGLLNDQYGLEKGARLALSLAKAAAAASVHSIGRWFALASAYSFLTEPERKQVVETLKTNGELDSLRLGLAHLVALYPQCPLVFLFEDQPPAVVNGKQKLEGFKAFIQSFFNKHEVPGTLAQANAIYIAFVTGILHVTEGVSLNNFPAVAEYPNTEESKKVGASVRASVGGMIAFFLEEHSYSHHSPWSRYFWNRGLEIEKCTFQGDSET